MVQEAQAFGNPFENHFMRTRKAGPFNFVIFGASGDLTARKLLPALFNLYVDGFLPDPFSITGFARREKSHDDFRKDMADAIKEFSRQRPESDEQLKEFLACVYYVTGTFEDAAAYDTLGKHLQDISKQNNVANNRVFYLATPPGAFETIINRLKSHRLIADSGSDDEFSRLVIEKPFGRDLKTATELNRHVHEAFHEDQVYRIDHYLGKETVQNILVFRLGNAMFEPLWNRRYIDNVQITGAESIGIGGRAGYFDKSGIIRDMVQSHLMQVMTLIAMEPPSAFDATAIRDEKAKVLKAIRQYDPDDIDKSVVRGQYAAGSVGGDSVCGYLDEDRVPDDSKTDTYVAMRLHVDNWRWSGVPFYLRSGKRLAKRVTEIAITFNAPPHLIFSRSGPDNMVPNVLRIRIQPQEGISLSIGAKVPGQEVRLKPVMMDFLYDRSFRSAAPEAYERLILDAITGDSTLFAREDEVEQSWRFIDNIIHHWSSHPLHAYSAGGWGPEKADALLASDGRGWVRL